MGGKHKMIQNNRKKDHIRMEIGEYWETFEYFPVKGNLISDKQGFHYMVIRVWLTHVHLEKI